MQTNTTNLSLYLNNMDYEDDDCQAFDESWFITRSYSTLVIPGVFIVVCLCGLMGNMMVVLFLSFHMKKNPFTVYVLNLAISDFSLLLFILVILTLYMISTVGCFFSFKFHFTKNILMVVFLFWYYASMFLLTAMGLERCAAVLFPLWYRCHCPKHLLGIMCGVLWTLAGLSVSLAFITCSLFHYEHCEKVLHSLSIVTFIIFSAFPFLSNLSLFIKLRCGSQRRHPGKLYVAVLLSVIFMFIFGLPLTVVILMHHLRIPLIVLYIAYLLASLNSSINPLIYFLVESCRQRRIQGSIKVAFHRVFTEKGTSEEGSHVPEDTVVESTL